MSYTLISSDRSPFGRICRMYLIKHGIPFEYRPLNFVDDAKAAAELAKETPINKVPLLIDSGNKVFDSRVIINYVSKKHGLKPLTREEENFVSVVYGALDAGVILFLMKKDGFDLERSDFFVKRNRQRILSALDYVKSHLEYVQGPENWNYPAMALYAFLYWSEARLGMFRIGDFPELAEFQKSCENAPGAQETGF